MNLPVHNLLRREARPAKNFHRQKAVARLGTLFVTLVLLSLNVAAQQPSAKRVLVITGSDPNYPGFSIITKKIISTLREGSATRVEFIYELQEALVNPPESAERDQQLIDYFKMKYDHQKIDLILVLAAPRLRILIEKDRTLFASVPKVFYDFDSELEATNRSLGPNVTGVWASLDFRKTLDLALTLQPGTRKVVVLSGNGVEDQTKREKAEVQFSPYRDKLEFSYLSGETIDELKVHLAALPKNTVVVFLLYSSDRLGHKYSGPEALSMFAPATSAPIYSYSTTLLGLGIIGGNLLDFEKTGDRIGKMSLRVLQGEEPKQIPEEVAPTVMSVDWRELQRWGISEQSIPPGTVVNFRRASLWEQYKWYVSAASLAFVLESLLIVWLLVMDRRRRSAELERERFALLAESEHRRLDEVVSNVPGVVWETRLQPDIDVRKTTFISDYVEKMLGYTPKQWLAFPPGFGLTIIPEEEERERVSRDNNAVIETGREGFTQHRWTTKDGRIIWVETHQSPVEDENGKIVGLRGVTLDVTERKQAEETLQRTEEKSSGILRAIPDLIFVQTLDGVYLDYHATDWHDLIVPPEEFLGKNMRDVLPPELAAEFQSCFERAMENQEPQLCEYKLTLNQAVRWFEARIVRTGDNILTVVRDVTERKLSTEALRESEARFRNMADGAPVMIWIAGADKLRTYFNRQWLDFTGRTLHQELGGGWTQGIHPEDYDHLMRTYSSVFDTKDTLQVEYRLRRWDGEYRWVFSRGTPRFSAAGEFLGYIGSTIDITERKENEQALQKAHEELKELKNQLEAENIYLQQELQADQTFGEILGQSDGIKYVLYKINQVASTDSTVLILGETGTGKELVARAIHNVSSRKERPLIKVNCAALSASLIESEFFGHEKGAFTGATARKLGRFELANEGTIFLDEIGELPADLQVKLLRVIQEGEFERVGGSKTIKVDVRIIAATNRNLQAEVEKGTFREDLWYRLNVFPITVPPLRQRRDDIPLLVEHFVQKFSKQFGKNITSVTTGAMHSLQVHSWPGNVRELANVIERAVIHAQNSHLHLVDRFEEKPDQTSTRLKSLEEMEREYIIRILENTGWRVEGRHGAARILGMNPSTLRTRMSKFGIQRRTVGAN